MQAGQGGERLVAFPRLNLLLRAQIQQLTAPRRHLEHGPEPRVAELSRDNQRRAGGAAANITAPKSLPSASAKPRQPLGHPWPLTWLA